MCDEFNKIQYENIEKSMNDYCKGREKSTTKNYFRYKDALYPVMNIVKVAIENNSDIVNNRLYDNLPRCKYILNQLLEDEIIFYKLEEKI